MSEMTNILIVGNGFDLSHYLPTKYEHFMSVMKNIENWSKPNENMSFDDLFEKDNWFFQKTKSIYQSEKISISASDIESLKNSLQKNVWYTFFTHHLSQIDTWIDFELEFSKALDVVAFFSEQADGIYKEFEKIQVEIFSGPKGKNTDLLFFQEKTLKKLSLLNLIELVDSGYNEVAKVNKQYYRNKNTDLDIDFHLIINDLEFYLNDFISLFRWYLQHIVQKLESKNIFNIKSKSFEFDDLLVLSFNYTSTFSHFYSSQSNVEYVHGSVDQDLVLGIPDMKNEFLKKFKNYSFTKYHQKLLKDTDYLFLKENPKIKSMFNTNSLGQRNINIYIWGHSLADSDENYIHEIFSLNRKDSIKCSVIVYFYGNDAPKLLNNLLDILGKDLIEQWMKNGWLKFEKNPEIDFGV